jgi:hypothetical protein
MKSHRGLADFRQSSKAGIAETFDGVWGADTVGASDWHAASAAITAIQINFERIDAPVAQPGGAVCLDMRLAATARKWPFGRFAQDKSSFLRT